MMETRRRALTLILPLMLLNMALLQMDKFGVLGIAEKLSTSTTKGILTADDSLNQRMKILAIIIFMPPLQKLSRIHHSQGRGDHGHGSKRISLNGNDVKQSGSIGGKSFLFTGHHK